MPEIFELNGREWKISTTIETQETEFEKLDRLDFSEADRDIFVNEDIGEEFGAWFTSLHRYLTKDPANGSDPITVWLNTPGGDAESAFVFHDIVRSSIAPITVIGVGGVHSAGVLMLACGHHRMVTENCTLMTHESTCVGAGASGMKYSEAKARRQWEDWIQNRYTELIARYTPEDSKYWKRVISRETEYWLLGGAAIVEAGLADGIYTGPRSLKRKVRENE